MSMTHIGGYEIIGELGRGGMGVVFLARQPSLDRLVAIKLLAIDDPALAERLEQEARRLADLRHPNIVTVIDVGREQGQPFYVMTYCGGGTLSAVLERDGRLRPGQASGVLASMAEALAEVHERGLVHRDVKPSNVLLSEGGQPYLGDLGIAIDSGADRPTTTGAVLGTIGYTAPEIIEGGKVTPAADVFGLGVLAYQLVAGEQPYRGAHIAAVMDAVRAGRRRPLIEAAPDAPPELCALIESAMATDPAERPSDLKAWARQLHDAARPEPIEAVGAPEVTGVTVFSDRRPASLPEPDTGKESAPGTSKRRLLVLCAVLIALVALVGGAVAVQGGDELASGDEGPIGAEGPFQRDLAIRQSADGVVVAERWTLEDGTLGSQVVAKNSSDSERPYQLDVIVPKEVAESVDDVRWGSDYTSVVQADPIVRYCLTLAPGQQRQLTWSVSGLDDAGESDLAAWAAAWEEDLRAHVGAAGGEPCPGTTPPEEVVTEVPEAGGEAELAGAVDFGATPNFAGASGATTTGGDGGGSGGSTAGGGSGVTTGGENTSDAGGSTSPSGGGETVPDPPPAPATTTTPSTTRPAPTADNCPGGDYSGSRYDGSCGTRPADNCPGGDWTGNAYDGSCGTRPADNCPGGDWTGNAYDGSCGTRPVDSCNGGDYSGSPYDGSCGNAPPVANNDTSASIGFGPNESGTKCWSPLVVNPLGNDSDREGSGLTAIWAGNARDSSGGQLALGGSVVQTFNSSGNPKICMTRSYATGKNWIKIDYRARDTGGAESNVATITIPVFVQ
jgi:hypothetical protein